MGRVPLLVLVSACTALFACTPDAEPPESQTQDEAKEEVRNAGQAAREAVKKAGEALRRLSGGSEETPPPLESSGTQDPAVAAVAVPEVTVPVAPVPEVPADIPATPAPSHSPIAPIPDETQQLEDAQNIQVERDASVATQEAKEKILEATRRAAERFRQAGEGMVDAFRHDNLTAQDGSDTMGGAAVRPEAGSAASNPTPAEAPKPE